MFEGDIRYLTSKVEAKFPVQNVQAYCIKCEMKGADCDEDDFSEWEEKNLKEDQYWAIAELLTMDNMLFIMPQLTGMDGSHIDAMRTIRKTLMVKYEKDFNIKWQDFNKSARNDY